MDARSSFRTRREFAGTREKWIARFGDSLTVIVAVGVTVGIDVGARHKMDLKQWTVAARGFGGVPV